MYKLILVYLMGSLQNSNTVSLSYTVTEATMKDFREAWQGMLAGPLDIVLDTTNEGTVFLDRNRIVAANLYEISTDSIESQS